MVQVTGELVCLLNPNFPLKYAQETLFSKLFYVTWPQWYCEIIILKPSNALNIAIFSVSLILFLLPFHLVLLSPWTGRAVADKEICTDGSRWKVDCNWCTCANGIAACTLKFCITGRESCVLLYHRPWESCVATSQALSVVWCCLTGRVCRVLLHHRPWTSWCNFLNS